MNPKTYTLFALLMGSLLSLSAQLNALSNFQLQHVSESYQPLSKQSPNRIEVDDLSQVFGIPVNLPFTYQLAGQPIDSIVIVPDGELNLYARGAAPGEVISLSAFGTDLTEKALDGSGVNSKITFATEGTLGNRILKIEYEKMGFGKGGQTDEISFQIWLYENMPVIEYRYGPMQIADTAAIFDRSVGGWPPVVGLAKINWIDETATGVFLSGDGTAPQVVVQNGELSYEVLSSPPATDSVYRFCLNGICRNTTSVDPDLQSLAPVKLFPNPTYGHCELEVEVEQAAPLRYTIYNLRGQAVAQPQQQRLQTGMNHIPLETAHLHAGLYVVQGWIADRPFQQRMIIK